MIKDSVIVVWFSCGAASAVAAKKTIEKYGHNNTIRVVNNPIKEEHPDNQRFLRDVQDWVGVDIEFALNSKYLSASCVDVWEKRKFMSGTAGAPCTLELKKKARQEWELANTHDYIVLGFTVDERKRHDRFVLSERGNVIPILIDEGITKGDCYRIISDAGLSLPEIYKLGFPNANCIGCVKAGSATYWNHVRKHFPDIFEQRSEMSRRIGAKLAWYKGGRIFLDELPEDAVGLPLKGMDFECGLFCEER